MRSRRSVVGRARRSMTVLAVLAVLVSAVVFVTAWAAYTVDVRGDELALQVLAISKGIDAEGVPEPGVRERVFRIEARLIGAALAVTDAEGLATFSTTGREGARYPIGEIGSPGEGGVRRGVRSVDALGRVLVAAAPLADGGWLVAVQPVGEVRGAFVGVLGLVGAGALAAFAVAWAAGGWFAAKLTSPLVRLRDAAEAVAEGEWGRTVLVEGDDEVASLARSFNRMSARVAAAYAAQKDFTGDVSHELRTPITSIRGFAEALADGTVTDPAAMRHHAGTIRDEATRLAELTSVLLALADLDAGVVELAREPVEPVPLAEALDMRFATRADEEGVRLEVPPPGEGAPLGDTYRLLQAATILVENAIRYTPAGGEVRVTMGAEDGEWRLLVDDTGPGIPAEQREAVFGRFTRLDRSRSSGKGGSGLGLALCRKLVGLMDGTVEAHESPLGGARFVIAMPLAS